MERLHDACKKGDDDYDFDEIDGYDEMYDIFRSFCAHAVC